MSWRVFNKLSVTSFGGISLYCFFNPNESKLKTVFNSWTTNHKPSVEWDPNWDHRASTSIVKPLPEGSSPEKENAYNEKLDKHKSKAIRHIIMIRHGQYNLNGASDPERYLTELGRTQAKITGQRLAELKLPIDEVVISTMTRAQETGKIILEQLPQRKDIKVSHDSLIEEGAPIPPEPKVGHWRPEPAVSLPHLNSDRNYNGIRCFKINSIKTISGIL
jgi:serine/threonine-protein phosphatase PGAM5